MLRTLGRSGHVDFFWTLRSGTFSLLTIATIICLLSGCSGAQQLPANTQPPTVEKKVLIVYLSRTNNTKAIAEFIHQKVGGTMVALELETPYPADYNATVEQVARENETFSSEARKANQALVDLIGEFAAQKKATPAQIALAWVLAQKPWIAPIPGTTKLHRLEENLGAVDVELTVDDFRQIKNIASRVEVKGARYSEGAQKLVNR